MSGRTLFLWKRATLLLVMLAGAALLFWVLPQAEGVTVNQEKTIAEGETETWADDTWELKRNLYVNGTLILDNATLRYIESTEIFWTITVGPKGELQVRNGSMITSAPEVYYNLTVHGSLQADNATFENFFGAIYAERASRVNLTTVALKGQVHSYVGLRANGATILNLIAVEFRDLESIGLVTVENPGYVLNPDWSGLEAGVLHQRHSHLGRFDLTADTGISLTGSIIAVENDAGSILSSWRWSAGVQEVEVLAWTEDDLGQVVTEGPYDLTAQWELISDRQSELCECDFAWGEAVWSQDLDWSAEGPAGVDAIQFANPGMNLTLGQAKVVTAKPEQWEPLSVEVTLYNPNPIKIHRVKVHMLLGIEPISVKIIEDLGPYNQTTFLINWTQIYRSGTYDLDLILDPDEDLTQWNTRSGDHVGVQVKISEAEDTTNGGGLWIVAIILLCLIGLVGYVIFSNLKVEEEGMVSDPAMDEQASLPGSSDRELIGSKEPLPDSYKATVETRIPARPLEKESETVQTSSELEDEPPSSDPDPEEEPLDGKPED